VLTHWEGEPVRVWADLWGVPLVEAHEVIGSTNDRIRELGDQGCSPRSVVIAEEQTQGRGRGSAIWHSPPGSGLWISTLLTGPPESPPYLPLVVGLAVARAIEHVVDGADARIEWPNDVLLGGHKVAGVLCESPGYGVVVGLGVNVRTPPGGFPSELSQRAGSLEGESGLSVSRSALAGALLRELGWLTSALAGDGADEHVPAGIHDALQARDALLGRTVVSEQAGPGTARGIDSRGGLILERPDGSRVSVLAGSVTPA
jgi:BirA family biotin operon repressor/biotin-[acetyl-CoA-carboxylase] ligase